VKIRNLSLSVINVGVPCAFSEFAIALAAIQAEFAVLLGKYAGNWENLLTSHPVGRLHQGTDSVCSLAAGSFAHNMGKYTLARVDNLSPFSRIGSGPEFPFRPRSLSLIKKRKNAEPSFFKWIRDARTEISRDTEGMMTAEHVAYIHAKAEESRFDMEQRWCNRH
jgi:hypothetical protein